MEFLKTIKHVFSDISDAYSGTYRSSNDELNEYRTEVKDIRIPTTKEDRENLKNDRNQVENDFKKVVDRELNLV